ncbi:MAG: serine/threonine protein kinase [Polyangiaceae bacterium]|nr:serine/threonine protein kinase [Polyangiaceae bacterium]MCL4749159.1 serine/threonine protein kinase [Myxococcales bacterium]
MMAALVHDLDPRPGMVISGRYRLDARIGEGAFGQVFRATDLKDGAGVALKLLSAESVDAAGLERFRREAELATKLQHPNTIRLIGFNLRSQAMPFIVYELLEGEPLKSLMSREGPLAEARAAAITMQVLRSLMEAHEVGIVHRDIKPGNVFVCSDESRLGSIKVLDFGIAKSVDGTEAQVTAAGILVGTPRYMPPEQIRGETPIPAMDLYATGMMLAEMLSGEPTLTCSAAEACLEQLRPERIPLPPFLQSSRLWPVIWRATDKDTATRYSTANEMLGDLERVYDGLSPAPLIARAPREDGARSSFVPTTVMANPELAPVASGSPAEGRSVTWLVAAFCLFALAIAGTAYGLYWIRTQGAL